MSGFQELANAKGNILENKELLDSLNKTKASSITISDSLTESVRLQASLDQVCKDWHSILFLYTARKKSVMVMGIMSQYGLLVNSKDLIPMML